MGQVTSHEETWISARPPHVTVTFPASLTNLDAPDLATGDLGVPPRARMLTSPHRRGPLAGGPCPPGPPPRPARPPPPPPGRGHLGAALSLPGPPPGWPRPFPRPAEMTAS